jgi:adenylate cyclase
VPDTTKEKGFVASFLRMIASKHWLRLLLPGLLVTAAVTFLHWKQPLWLRFLDYKIYDILLENRPRPEPTGNVAIIDLDEKTLAEIGQWPWPRYQVALLLARLKQYGALAVGMDIVFAEPDQTSPERIKRELGALGVNMDFTGLPQGLRDNDELLAKNLSDGPYVLGYFFTFLGEDASERGADCVLPPPRVALRRSPGLGETPLHLAQANQAVCPLPVLVKGGGWAGFFNSFPDHDNIVRWVPLVIGYKDAVYPSLAVATLMRAFGDKGAALSIEQNPYGGQDQTFVLDLGPLGKRLVPLDRNGRMLLDYRGPARTFPYYSASDVMRGRIDPSLLEGKVVFIGASARGLQDIRATPLDQTYPGVECHATAADSIIAGRYLRCPIDAWYIEQVLLMLFGLGVTVQLVFTRSLWVGVASVLAGASMWYGSSLAMNRMDIYLSPLSPLMALAVNFTLLTFLKFLREESQKRFIQGAFSQYLSPKVVEQLVAEPEKLNLTGEEKDMSILFSDVRSFTSISERLTPTQVVDLLHEYFTPMTRLITGNLGTMDKFIGDAIMAFWNAPADVPDHPRRAVTAALSMMLELDNLNVGFKERFGFEVHAGIGIHHGLVRVGNFGSADLFDYTIIGDNVNLCSRLEGLTKYYHQRVLATQAMRDSAGEGFLWQEVDRVRVKGKLEPVTIHALLTGARPGELDKWEKGLALYRECRFDLAKAIFTELLAETGSGLYELFAGRCDTLGSNPPAAGWDGVFEHTTK